MKAVSGISRGATTLRFFLRGRRPRAGTAFSKGQPEQDRSCLREAREHGGTTWIPLVFPSAKSLQISALSAKLTVLVPATTKWSSTRTSTKANACLRLCVSSSSARLGSATPEG